MKKIALLFIVLFCTAVTAQDMPRIAVYVIGNIGDDEKSALGTRMLASLSRSGRYRGIERSSAFVAELEREHETQRSGAVDDAQISALGRRFGVKYVCIAAITPAFGSFQVSARIVDVESAEVVSIGEAFSPLRTGDDLTEASNKIIAEMFGETVRRDSEPIPETLPAPAAPPAAQPADPPRPRQQPLKLTIRISAAALALGGTAGGIAFNEMAKTEYEKWHPAETLQDAHDIQKRTESLATTRNLFYILAGVGLSGLTLTFFF